MAHAGGAPTKYDESYNDLAYKYSLLGATDKDLADFMNVCEATINNWKRDYPLFLESIKAGKEKADANVAKSLYKRANGYEYKEEIKEARLNKETGEYEMQTTKVITKQVAPDTTAAIYWTKNRQPKMWRDKQELEHSGEVKTTQELSDEQLDKVIKELEGKHEK